MLLLIN